MPNPVMDYTVQLNGQSELLDYAAQVAGDGNAYNLLNRLNAMMQQNPYSELTHDEQFAESLYKIIRENGYDVEYNGNNQWTAGVFQRTAETVTQNPANSNLSSISRGNLRQMYGTINEFDGTHRFMQMSRFPVSGGLGSKAMYTLGSMAQAGMAVSAGVWLGKTIDSALYNLNPNYWDSIGMSTLNPETWSGLTNDQSPFAGLFNFILGLDPDSGTAQMYVNQDSLAYMAYALARNGWFNQPEGYVSGTVGNIDPFDISTYGTVYCSSSYGLGVTGPSSIISWYTTYEYTVTSGNARIGNLNGMLNIASLESGVTFHVKTTQYNKNGEVTSFTENDYELTSSAVINGVRVYFTNTGGTGTPLNPLAPTPNPQKSMWSGNINNFWLALAAGTYHEGADIDGVGNQPDATLPDISTWNDLSDVLPSLQQQYPDAFANPMVWNSDQPYADSTGNTTTYIPVPFPNISSMTDTQPTSGTQTQTSTDTSTMPDALVDLLMKMVQQTQPDTQSQTPPQNPVDTGTGTSPTPIAPTGSASALWSVYHPTQAQVNSFGAWLWTDNIITQIQQVLQNPMEGIITLHKVFATPVDAGSGTIVVGRLDSEVPSATVTQQYVEVDCGSVDCHEQFGNVFDYDPFTNVSLYLPFIGIVPLNVSDVMRSTLTVKYGVDVFTGACLAMVEVARDGNTVNMYQYAGVASVEYPLTGSVHSGLISGLLGFAGGAISAVMSSTGIGAAAGLAMAGGILGAGQTNNARSGGFSGNAGAMGIKKPYLILERPQTKVADAFPVLAGYPTNVSNKLSDFSGQVNVKSVHVEGINATDAELKEIEALLKSGVLV